jgi:CheY-like chemotaxis protein
MSAPEIVTETRALAGLARPLHLLVVEDDEDSRDLLCAAVALRGHTSETAATGREAIERAVGGAHDAVFVDIGLPDIEGYEVARRIRAQLGAACPRLIALTGYTGPDEEKRAKGAGFDVRLSKPAELESIFRVLGLIPKRAAVALRPFAERVFRRFAHMFMSSLCDK